MCISQMHCFVCLHQLVEKLKKNSATVIICNTTQIRHNGVTLCISKFVFSCPIHVVTFTLISNLVTDYIQRRAWLVTKFDIKVKVTTWIVHHIHRQCIISFLKALLNRIINPFFFTQIENSVPFCYVQQNKLILPVTCRNKGLVLYVICLDNLLNYYSPTVADGKTFVLVFCILQIDSTQLFTRRKRLGRKFCHLQQSVNSTLISLRNDFTSP